MSDKFNSYAGSKADSRSAAPSGGGRTSRANSIGSGSISGAPGGGAGAGGVAPIASASGGGGGAVGVAGSAGGAASGGGAARVIKSGLLSKKAEVMKSWRPRFFVLEDQRLVYFIARDDDKPKAIALVKGCTVTDPQAIENGLFEFVATFPNSKGVVYHLASDNRAEADAWVRAIRTVATPEFTRGRLQEIEDKERAVSRVAHQSRLPGPAFELLQAAQSQAAGWYMAEAGPAYRSWLHVCFTIESSSAGLCESCSLIGRDLCVANRTGRIHRNLPRRVVKRKLHRPVTIKARRPHQLHRRLLTVEPPNSLKNARFCG